MFVAVPLSGDAALALISALPPLPGRPVEPPNLHITIRFLGRVDEVVCDRLRAGLDEAELGGPFRIALGDIGAFARAARASVLWVAITEGTKPLRRLYAVVEDVCERVGFEPEDRSFAPHLTISRLRPEADVRSYIESYTPEPISWTATELVLFESHLGRGGAVYEPLEGFPL